MIHPSQTSKRALNQFFISSVNETQSDTTDKKFSSHCRRISLLNQANIMIHLQARILRLDQINFYHFLNVRNHILFCFRIRERIPSFPKLAYPVVKVSGGNAILLTPLVIRQPALAAFHDQSNLIIFTNTFAHNDYSPLR